MNDDVKNFWHEWSCHSRDREDMWRRFGLGSQEFYNGDSKLDVLVSVQAELSATV